ncbi:MAG: DUF3881 family protein [Lachnospiraceae bacterium]|nr:DUF3881 family protein [Lachnospiraceae bacterium]
MHSFLKTIGFSQLNNRAEVEKLIHKVVNEAHERHLVKTENASIAEISMEFAENIGITVRGEYDEQDGFHVEHYFPFFRGRNVSTKEEVYISKRVDTDAYTGMCDDYRLGVSLIFYLQNVIDYMNVRAKNQNGLPHQVTLAALALDGKILLPVEKKDKKTNTGSAEVKQRTQLIAEAKKGNQEAIDSLTIDDIDLYAMVSKRIKYEDIYSIVDTSFIPYGSESDNYTILGTILDCHTVVNSDTQETLYVLSISCNDLNFDLCINKKDLFGEPLPGRRFRGNIWMQGSVDFL